VEGNLFIFGLVCYICPGSQKINILTAQYKKISNEQAVCDIKVPKMGSHGIHLNLGVLKYVLPPSPNPLDTNSIEKLKENSPTKSISIFANI
jgi:hypothetical protein